MKAVLQDGEILNNKKENKPFLLLSVFGIIFVVIGHFRYIDVFLHDIFPYSSFHMALFAFISGYFFKKDRKIIDFMKTKIKKLLIPYFVWNIVYGIIVNILKYFNIIKYGGKFSFFNIFVAPFYGDGNQFVFNVSAWFVISIFFVQLIYFFINKINSKLKLNTEIPVTIVSIIIAYFQLNLVKQGYNNGIWFLITRVSFLMPFYAIGQVYKKIEKYEIKNNIVYFTIIVLIQCVLLQRYTLTYNLNLLRFNSNFLIHLISGMTGILFWLRISKILANYIGENKIINYVGNNTYGIMTHHVFAFFLINTIILIINTLTRAFGKFDFNSYQTNVFYFYGKDNPALALVCIIVAIAMPILITNLYLILKKKIRSRFFKKCI